MIIECTECGERLNTRSKKLITHICVPIENLIAASRLVIDAHQHVQYVGHAEGVSLNDAVDRLQNALRKIKR